MRTFEDFPVWVNAAAPIQLLMSVVLAFAIFRHYKTTVEYYKVRKEKGKPIAVIHFGPFVIALLYLCWNLNMCVSYVSVLGWMPFQFKYDFTAIVISSLLYLAAKSLTYVLFVTRIHFAFRHSLYGYSKQYIGRMYALVGIYITGMLGVILCFVYLCPDYSKREMPLMFVLPFLLFDSHFSMVATIAFLSRLRVSLKNRRKGPTMEILPFKYAMINMVAVMSTLVSLLLLALTGMGALMPFDGFLNTMCLFYTSVQWNEQFLRKCTPVMVCVASVPCLMQDAHQIEFVAKRALVATKSAQQEQEQVHIPRQLQQLAAHS